MKWKPEEIRQLAEAVADLFDQVVDKKSCLK
jgi:hypothetical protein